MSRKHFGVTVLTLCFVLHWGALVMAQGQAEAKDAAQDSEESVGPAEFEALAKLLTNSVFEGHFTIDGQDVPPKKEQYFLRKVKKLPEADYWLIQTRIKYGDHDVTVPISLPIKWAGKTPVITVDELTIPGLGTFNARVVISDGKYAGTWRHGKVGGHLFGVIREAAEETDSKSANEESANSSAAEE